jgi:hypothetical protein
VRRFSDAQIGAALREIRRSATDRAAAEVASAAGLDSPIKLYHAECGKAPLRGGELSAVLAELGANFQILHLRLHGSDLQGDAMRLMGAMAQLMEEVSG